MNRTTALLSVIIPLTGCATAHTTSQRSVDAVPALYAKMLVAVAVADLRLRIDAESSFVKAAAGAGVALVPYHALFLPGRTYDQTELSEAMQKQGIEAVLIVSDHTLDAPTVTSSALAIPLPQGQTLVTGSQRVEQDKFTISSELWDVAKQRLVWVGSTRLARNGATEGNFLGALADDVIRSLVKDSVVQGTAHQ